MGNENRFKAIRKFLDYNPPPCSHSNKGNKYGIAGVYYFECKDCGEQIIEGSYDQKHLEGKIDEYEDALIALDELETQFELLFLKEVIIDGVKYAPIPVIKGATHGPARQSRPRSKLPVVKGTFNSGGRD